MVSVDAKNRSFITYNRWNNTFLWEGSKRDLTKEDLYKVITTDESQVLGNKLEHEWNKELEKRKKASEKKSKYNPSLNKAIARAFGPGFLFWGIYVFYEEILLRIFQPLFMGWFIRYFSSEDHAGIGDLEVCAYGAGVVLMSALYTFTHHQYFFGVMHTGMILRVAHCSFIYRKVKQSIYVLKPNPKRLKLTLLKKKVTCLNNASNAHKYLPGFPPLLRQSSNTLISFSAMLKSSNLCEIHRFDAKYCNLLYFLGFKAQ